MDVLLAQRLVFAFGVVNFLALSALFFSCRCMGVRGPFSRLFRFKAFAKFYGFRCYFWAILWGSVVTHLVIAIRLPGIPFGT
jgi:ABC-type Co2+ transport system permease subunit